MNGIRPRWAAWQRRAFLIVAPLVFVVATVNALSLRTEAAREGASASPLPFVTEYTSALGTLALLPFLLALLGAVPLTARPRWRVALAHFAGSVLFSLLHVGLMVLLREIVWPLAAGGEYRFFGDVGRELLYEYRKDALSYLLILAVAEGVRRSMRGAPGRPAQALKQTRLPLKTGSRTTYLDPQSFSWARAAGNYVEVGGDGPPILARDTLKALEAALIEADVPAVRTHRSWLVNLRAVREVRADGQGGATALLAGGDEVPVSRAYRAAVEQRLSR